MEIKSKDLNAKGAIAEILKFSTVEEIKTFISEDDERTTVLEAAAAREKAITAPPPVDGKQGQQTGPITQDAADFKTGVQKTKSHVTLEDVIEMRRKQGEEV